MHALGGVDPASAARRADAAEPADPDRHAARCARGCCRRSRTRCSAGRSRQAEAVGLVEALAAADESHAGEVCVGTSSSSCATRRTRTIQALDLTHERRARGAARGRARADAPLPRAAARHVRRAHQPRRGGLGRARSSALTSPASPPARSGSDLALAITMVCATAFLDARRVQRALRSASAPAREAREDDPRQRRGVAGAADRGARRLLPGRVQARPPDRRAALDGAAPPLRPRRRRR